MPQGAPGSSEPEDASNVNRDSQSATATATDSVVTTKSGTPSKPESPTLDTPAKDSEDSGEEESPKKRFAFLRELPVLIILAFVLALLIKTFLVQAFFIPSASMESTLLPGDRVLVSKVDYRLHEPRQGDVIVFENPHPIAEPHRNPVAGVFHWFAQGLGFSQSPDEDFIKRVIGLPGDTVKVTDGGTFVNGVKLDEPYVLEGPGPTGTWHVAADSVFVMGDNRANSNDSRVSLGSIPIDKIVGKAFIKIWPPSRIGGL